MKGFKEGKGVLGDPQGVASRLCEACVAGAQRSAEGARGVA